MPYTGRIRMWVVVLCVFSVGVSAQQLKTAVTSVPTAVWLSPDASRQPLTTLAPGTVLQVRSQDREWYQVTFRDPRWGDRAGYVRVSDVALPPTTISSPPPTVTAPPPVTPSPAQMSEPARPTVTGSEVRPTPATIEQSQPTVAPVVTAERVVYDYTAMYEALNPSIVKIHADSGTGSGALVDTRGMIATNHHVIRNARYIAVEFADGRKVSADIVLLDARNDLAILKVNSSTVRSLRAVPLLPREQDHTVKTGVPVIAFGSPLSQTFLMTQGIISKVEPAVLLGDFLIQPGNSGGPLVNLSGQVVGINTFAERGISGAVRVNKLREALASSTVASYAGPEPDASELPIASRERFPTDVLKERVLKEALDLSSYTLDGGRFTVTAVTPVLIGKLQVQSDLQQAANRYSRRAKKIKDDKFDPVDEPFYDWYRNATHLMDAVVTFEIKPDFGQTTGSAWASALNAFAAGYSGRPMMPTRQTMEFKAEFQEMRLYRDGELVPPITPGRQITEQSINEAFMSFVDEAYSGWYVYHPSVFKSGKSYRIDVFDAREPGRVHRSITLNESSKVLQQIRRDFHGVADAR